MLSVPLLKKISFFYPSRFLKNDLTSLMIVLISLGLIQLSIGCDESVPKASSSQPDGVYQEWFTLTQHHQNHRFHHLDLKGTLLYSGTTHLKVYDLGLYEGESFNPDEVDLLFTDEHRQSAPLIFDQVYTDQTTWESTLSGLRALHVFKITIECVIEHEGETHRFTHDEWIQHPPLPASFPPIQLNSNPFEDQDQLSQSKYIFMSLFKWDPRVNQNWGMLVATDRTGTPLWSFKNNQALDSYVIWPEKGIFFIQRNQSIVHLNQDAQIVNEWHASDFGLDSIHHELIPLDNGHMLTVGTRAYPNEGQLRNLMSMDPEYMDPEYIIADLILELDLENRTVVKEIDLYSYWDPSQHFTQTSFGRFWEGHYRALSTENTADWTHVNGLNWNKDTQEIIISVRHLDTLMALHWPSGERLWEYGAFGDVQLESDQTDVLIQDYPRHPHAPSLDQNGNLFYFDNGNGRKVDDPYSQAVQVKIHTDQEPPVAEQLWAYQLDNRGFAPFLGDVDHLDNRALITFGGLIADPSLPLGLPSNQKYARIIEVPYTDQLNQGQPLLDLLIKSSDPEGPGYSVYRAHPLADLTF